MRQLAHVDRRQRKVGGCGSRKCEQVPNQLAHVAGALDDDLHQFAALVVQILTVVFHKHLCESGHDAQWSVQVVRDGVGERLQFLDGLLEFQRSGSHSALQLVVGGEQGVLRFVPLDSDASDVGHGFDDLQLILPWLAGRLVVECHHTDHIAITSVDGLRPAGHDGVIQRQLTVLSPKWAFERIVDDDQSVFKGCCTARTRARTDLQPVDRLDVGLREGWGGQMPHAAVLQNLQNRGASRGLVLLDGPAQQVHRILKRGSSSDSFQDRGELGVEGDQALLSGDVPRHGEVAGDRTRRIAQRDAVALHRSHRTLETDQVKRSIGPLAGDDAGMHLVEHPAVTWVNEFANWQSENLAQGIRFHHREACGVHVNQTPIGGQNFDAVRLGFDDQAQELAIRAEPLFGLDSFGHILLDGHKVRDLSARIGDGGDGLAFAVERTVLLLVHQVAPPHFAAQQGVP